MTVRTLAEAAAEILTKSKSSAVAEPMKTMPKNVVDLGGSTLELPQGSNIGSAAAAVVGGVTPPGTKPDASSKEGMKKLASQPADSQGNVQSSPDKEYNNVSTAGYGYMKPTVNEDEEVSEDEEVVSEEEIEEETSELTEEDYAEILEAKKALIKKKMGEMGCKEDIDALFNGEELSEEFREKVTTIFETAVIARAVAVVEEMEEEILAAAEESIEEIKAELEEQVDAYLGYMVEEWVRDNELAIETGLKAEIVEGFMSDLKNLFVEHNISIPDETVDVLESMTQELDELTDKLNEQMNANIELSRKIDESTRQSVINSVCEGLTATQAEKVKTLAEGVEFTTEGEYGKKIGIIRENYFAPEKANMVKQAERNPIALTESEEPVQTAEVSPLMSRYVNALSRTSPR
ncbi:prohead core protein [uncultured Caudovirales phage]|uniref:Prohead core protein n=1 Tax=uncultured Caudovirales phage TaxID=2100421 RepID=A0A6J5KPW0_9CAUD|nr:prohead core protein [uncultured Caudovirales phage]